MATEPASWKCNECGDDIRWPWSAVRPAASAKPVRADQRSSVTCPIHKTPMIAAMAQDATRNPTCPLCEGVLDPAKYENYVMRKNERDRWAYAHAICP